jgi:ABC-type nitrate/sulfonate/bicarbonate transport system permease component
MAARLHPADRLRAPLAVLGLLLPLLLWQGAASAGALPEAVLPAPFRVITRAVAIAGDPEFQAAAAATVYRWLAGFSLGGMVGFIVGLLVGSTRWTRNAFVPAIDFFRSIPVTIAFPAFLLAFGLSDTANIAMAFTATVFLVALNVAVAVGTGAPQRSAFLALMQASWVHRVRYLHLPEAMDSFLLALRATLSLSLIVTLLSEMFIGARHGVGQTAYEAYLANSPETVFAIILWVGLAGMAANRGFGFLATLKTHRDC